MVRVDTSRVDDEWLSMKEALSTSWQRGTVIAATGLARKDLVDTEEFVFFDYLVCFKKIQRFLRVAFAWKLVFFF